MGKTYTNLINENEVSLAIEKVIVAPWPTEWTPARIDIASLAPPWKDLGAVVEDSPSLRVARSPFQLKTGLPQTLQYEAIMGVEGTFEFALYSSENRKVKYALSNVEPINITKANTPDGTCSDTCDLYKLVWASTPSYIPRVGDTVITGSATMTDISSRYIRTSENESIVTSISINDGILYFANGFPNTPQDGDLFDVLLGTKLPLGGTAIKKWSMIGVADFMNGVQVVHYFPKVSSAGEWAEQIRPDNVGRIAMQFSLYGYSSYTYAGSTEQLIVGERYYFH